MVSLSSNRNLMNLKRIRMINKTGKLSMKKLKVKSNFSWRISRILVLANFVNLNWIKVDSNFYNILGFKIHNKKIEQQII